MAYSLGVEAHTKVDFPTASAFFQRTITLDPNFAMAYGRLAITYVNTGEIQRGAENIRHLFFISTFAAWPISRPSRVVPLFSSSRKSSLIPALCEHHH
jgi:hypothetical protein